MKALDELSLNMQKINLHTNVILAFLILILSVPGCAVRYVADYDSSIKKETLNIAKKVDLFWGELLDTNVSSRDYTSFKKTYNEYYCCYWLHRFLPYVIFFASLRLCGSIKTSCLVHSKFFDEFQEHIGLGGEFCG